MSEVMQERYGVKSPRRRTTIVVATTVLAVVFLGWLAWAAWLQSDPAIDAAVSAYRVVDDHTVQVKIQMRLRNDHIEGTCDVGATARDHSPVGDQTFTVAQITAAKGDWLSITTLDRATTVELISCTQR
ncbi:MAG: DUF4307 domain-containing protein [Marmoricola sp.]